MAPNTAPYTDDIWYKDDLSFDDAKAWAETKTQREDIQLLHDVAYTVPQRDYNPVAPFVYLNRQGIQLPLPHGYRVPLMWIAKYLWETVHSLLTQPENGAVQKMWIAQREELLYLVLAVKTFLDLACDKLKNGGMEKGWRCLFFDRMLARLYRGQHRNRREYLERFLVQWTHKEYERDVLKHDWRRWGMKKHLGVQLSDDEIVRGFSSERLMTSLKLENGAWVVDPAALPRDLVSTMPQHDPPAPPVLSPRTDLDHDDGKDRRVVKEEQMGNGDVVCLSFKPTPGGSKRERRQVASEGERSSKRLRLESTAKAETHPRTSGRTAARKPVEQKDTASAAVAATSTTVVDGKPRASSSDGKDGAVSTTADIVTAPEHVLGAASSSSTAPQKIFLKLPPTHSRETATSAKKTANHLKVKEPPAHAKKGKAASASVANTAPATPIVATPSVPDVAGTQALHTRALELLINMVDGRRDLKGEAQALLMSTAPQTTVAPEVDTDSITARLQALEERVGTWRKDWDTLIQRLEVVERRSALSQPGAQIPTLSSLFREDREREREGLHGTRHEGQPAFPPSPSSIGTVQLNKGEPSSLLLEDAGDDSKRFSVDNLGGQFSAAVDNLVTSKLLGLVQGLAHTGPVHRSSHYSGGESSQSDLLVRGLVDEMRALHDEAVIREERLREDMHALREYNASEVEGLRRRLAYFEGLAGRSPALNWSTGSPHHTTFRTGSASISRSGVPMERDSSPASGARRSAGDSSAFPTPTRSNRAGSAQDGLEEDSEDIIPMKSRRKHRVSTSHKGGL